jgi:RNA polymerase sigma-70 factor (ECF subfamily)
VNPTREAPLPTRDRALITLLLQGDEDAFRALVHRYNAQMLRVARDHCKRPGVAEEVVQDTWVAILKGLPRFEGRSSLRSWMFRILSNRAKTRAVREQRVLPAAAMRTETRDPVEHLEQFAIDGHWASPPESWRLTPEAAAVDVEVGGRIHAAIDALPAKQRQVITYRDVLGWSSDEVCEALQITAVNQRVLLHRARSRVRDALATYLAGEPQTRVA